MAAWMTVNLDLTWGSIISNANGALALPFCIILCEGFASLIRDGVGS